ncbi:MAG: flagellar motor switch phosphatase FliY [Eubacteriales bacterium]
MSEGVLSQEEIDALLRSDALPSEIAEETPVQAGPPAAVTAGVGGDLNEIEKDAVGEVANIVMGSAATALSTLLGKKVEITAPVVQLTDPDRFRQDYPLPYLLVNVEYVVGLTGSNVLIIRDQDARVMVDLMMGGDGQDPPPELGEIHLSAISEAMNQMMGSASTAMSTILKERVEISPPTVETVNFATDELKGTVGMKGQTLVKVSFRMIIEDLVDSEIMQLIPLELGRRMVKNLMNQMDAIPSVEMTPEIDTFSIPDSLPVQQPVAPAPAQVAASAEPMEIHQPGSHMFEAPRPVPTGLSRVAPGGAGVPVQPVQFAPLQSNFQPKEIANIELIMDVPLQITVELGKSRKTIREILALGPGSVVELDKLAGEPVDLLVNGKLLAKGEVVVIDENFGIRITDIISPIERVANLQ